MGGRLSEMHLEISQLRKEFATPEGTVVALKDMNLHVEQGEFVCIVGASGSGKSTLLRLVAGLEQPTAGKITVDYQPVVGPGADRGMVFQDYTLYPWMTVQKNVEFGLKLQGTSKSERREQASYYLNMVGLADFAQSLPRQLSGGHEAAGGDRPSPYQPAKNLTHGRTLWGARYSDQRIDAAVFAGAVEAGRHQHFNDYPRRSRSGLSLAANLCDDSASGDGSSGD